MKRGCLKVRNIVLAVVLLLAALAGGLFIWWVYWQSKPEQPGANAVVMADTQDWELEMEEDNPGGAQEGTLIPGYGTVEMAAGSKELPISLGNPKENKCYFQVTAALPDGTILFETGYINPGQGITGIPLNKSMAPGTYEVILAYRCFSLDEQMTELNGVESGFMLTVQ